MTSQDQVLAAVTRACQKPVLVAIASQAQSPKKAADLAERNAERLGLSKQDIQDARWLAILRRDTEQLFGPGVDFLAALQQVSQNKTPQRGVKMKIVWGSAHYKEDVARWLQRVLESHAPQKYKAYWFNHRELAVYDPIADKGKTPRMVIAPTTRGDPVSTDGKLQPVQIIIQSADMLPVAKHVAKRWERRIPKAQHTEESVVIRRDY